MENQVGLADLKKAFAARQGQSLGERLGNRAAAEARYLQSPLALQGIVYGPTSIFWLRRMFE